MSDGYDKEAAWLEHQANKPAPEVVDEPAPEPHDAATVDTEIHPPHEGIDVTSADLDVEPDPEKEALLSRLAALESRLEQLTA